MPTLVEELAARHLGGPLPADFIANMAPLDDAGEEKEPSSVIRFTTSERKNGVALSLLVDAGDEFPRRHTSVGDLGPVDYERRPIPKTDAARSL